jgi:hypothetical protein
MSRLPVHSPATSALRIAVDGHAWQLGDDDHLEPQPLEERKIARAAHAEAKSAPATTTSTPVARRKRSTNSSGVSC